MLRRIALNVCVLGLTASLASACGSDDPTTTPGDGTGSSHDDSTGDGWGDNNNGGGNNGGGNGNGDWGDGSGNAGGDNGSGNNGGGDDNNGGGDNGSDNNGGGDDNNGGGDNGSGNNGGGQVMPGPDDPADGPAGSALLHGVWNEDYQFNMANHPLSWAIAVVHASMLYRDNGINFSPNAVLSIAIKESRLSCANPNPGNAQETMAVKDGCFQIEEESAYLSLVQLYGERFPSGAHGSLIGGANFETAALATYYYSITAMARFRDYRAQTGDPQLMFNEHPDYQTAQKVICGAYNRGFWWPTLSTIFRDCRTRDVLECFGTDVFDRTAYDHAKAIASYTAVLDQTTPFDRQVTLNDLKDYWTRIKPLYPEVSDATVEAALTDAFNQYSGSAASVSFNARIRQILAKLIAVLPAAPSEDEAARRLCDVGQLPCDLAP